MFIKKLGGSVVAITAVFAFSPAFAAECDQATLDGIAVDIRDYAKQLICEQDGGSFVGYPIWMFGKKKNEELGGCDVHLKLAQQLYVVHDDPPRDRGNPSNKGFREAQGAANALFDNKPVDALLHLNNFLAAIDTDLTTDDIEAGSAKLNPGNDDAESLAKMARNWAYNPLTGLGWRTEVEACQPDTTL